MFNINDFKTSHIVAVKQQESTIQIWPNPAGDMIEVFCKYENQCDKIRICTPKGLILKEIDNEAFPCKLSVKNFSKGIYVVEVIVKGVLYSEKLVVN